MDPENQTLNEDVSPIPEQVYSNKNFFNKKNILIITFVLVFILLSVIAINFLLSKKGISQKPETTPPITNSPLNEVTLSLEKGKEVQVQGTDLFLTLTEVFIPNPQCFDCVSSTVILARKGNEKTNLSYSCGGFAGKCTEELTSNGYVIKLKDTKNNSAQVLVKKLQ